LNSRPNVTPIPARTPWIQTVSLQTATPQAFFFDLLGIDVDAIQRGGGSIGSKLPAGLNSVTVVIGPFLSVRLFPNTGTSSVMVSVWDSINANDVSQATPTWNPVDHLICLPNQMNHLVTRVDGSFARVIVEKIGAAGGNVGAELAVQWRGDGGGV